MAVDLSALCILHSLVIYIVYVQGSPRSHRGATDDPTSIRSEPVALTLDPLTVRMVREQLLRPPIGGPPVSPADGSGSCFSSPKAQYRGIPNASHRAAVSDSTSIGSELSHYVRPPFHQNGQGTVVQAPYRGIPGHNDGRECRFEILKNFLYRHFISLSVYKKYLACCGMVFL